MENSITRQNLSNENFFNIKTDFQSFLVPEIAIYQIFAP